MARVLAVAAAAVAAGVGHGAEAAAPAACPGPVLRFEPVAPAVWLVRARPGVADADNRGQVRNVVLARDGAGLWALGSGPSPAFGRALACQARRALGAPLRWVVSPWARAELVLGVGGLAAGGPPPAHWAHAAVADAMAEQCPRCVAQLQAALGEASADLGPQPARLPDHHLHGAQGRLGPWHWWRLPRAPGRWVTVWRWRGGPLWFAPGLLGGEQVPDGRDADLAMLHDSLRQLAALADGQPAAAAPRWIGDRDGVQDSTAPLRQAAYWRALLDRAQQAMAAGALESEPAPRLDPPADGPAFSADWSAQPGHGLNWQRAWRQVEDPLMGARGTSGTPGTPR